MNVCLWIVLVCLLAVDGAVIDPNVQNVSPESNTTVAELLGPTNISFNCDTYETINGNVTQVTTAWFFRVPGTPNLVVASSSDPEITTGGTVRNDGGPFPTFNNRLTIVEMTDRLDGRTLYCGHSSQGAQQLAFWNLRLYRPPVLREGVVIKVAESDMNIPINIETVPSAYPAPTIYQWTRDGLNVQSDTRVTYSYPTVLFDSLLRSDSAVYNISATNHRLDNGQEIGTDTGEFTLDILYGPDFTPGPMEYAVLVGEPLVLVCGTGLDSNPTADIVWMDPSANVVSTGDRYTVNPGPAQVSVELSSSQASDTGEWMCAVTVQDPDVMVASGGMLVPHDNPIIGSQTIVINVTVVVPPTEPRQVEVRSADISPTSVILSWRVPESLGSPGVVAYRVIASDGVNPDIVYTSSNAATAQTITGLLPGVEYELSVQALSMAGNVEGASNVSQPIYINTTTTVPAPVCDNIETADGAIQIEWSFTHTGGLTLTALNISYYYDEGINQVVGPVTSVPFDSREQSIDDLISGRVYIFSIIAANAVGVATVECASVNHLIGVPGEPKQPTVVTMSTDSVRISLETTSAGVNSNEEFYYDVSYNTIPASVSVNDSFVVLGGKAVDRLITGLLQGTIYIFRVRARNRFGVSMYVTSDIINFNGTVTPTASILPLGAVVGGAVGGVIAVVLVVLVVIILIVLCIRCREGASYNVYSKKARILYLSPNDTTRIDSTTSGVKVEEIPVDIGLELQGEKMLHYADLDTFRPPSVTQKPATPTNQEERVQYATIDTFKQSADEPSTNGQSSNV